MNTSISDLVGAPQSLMLAEERQGRCYERQAPQDQVPLIRNDRKAVPIMTRLYKVENTENDDQG